MIPRWFIGLGVLVGVAAFLWPRKGSAMTVSDQKFFSAIPKEARQYADHFLRVGRERQLDPFLLVAIAMRESRVGQALTPPGPGGTGDYGHGRGIMQIDDRSHAAWLASNNWADPITNIRKGADVLKQKIAFLAGRSSVTGLVVGGSVTVGSRVATKVGVAPGQYPDPRPLSGDALTHAALAAYNSGEGSVLQAVAAGRDPDLLTANANYVRDVVARAGQYAASGVA